MFNVSVALDFAQFSLPEDWSSAALDNVLCTGQDINLPNEQLGRYQSLYLLTTTDSGTFSNNISGVFSPFVAALL